MTRADHGSDTKSAEMAISLSVFNGRSKFWLYFESFLTGLFAAGTEGLELFST